MGSAASTGFAATLLNTNDEDLKKGLSELSPESFQKLQAALKIRVLPLSDEAKKMIADKGWDKGIVGFGSPASEATVKVTSALGLLKKEHLWIELSFDDKPFENNSMGVKSKDYALLTGGYSSMPAVCIDGVMYVESVKIVKMWAEQIKAPKEVVDLIEVVDANDAALLEAAKHWGWCGLHESQDFAMVNKAHYDTYGFGKRDEAWEKQAASAVNAFLIKLEAVLSAKKEINGFYVGGELTLADCVLCNWPLTLGGVVGVNMDKYPNVQANHKKLSELSPEGMKAHLEGFPGFVGYVQGANKEKREGGFDINKYS